MTEIFDVLLDNLWIADFFAVFIFITIAIGRREISSSLLTQGLVVIISGTIIKYQALVNTFVGPTTSQNIGLLWAISFLLVDVAIAYALLRFYCKIKAQQKPWLGHVFAGGALTFVLCIVYLQFGPLWFGIAGPSHKVWQIVAYYLGAGLLDGVAIYVIHKTHVASNKRFSLLATTYLLAFFVAANIQVITFIEQYVWESNYFGGVYQWGLASINISTTIVAMIVASFALLQFCRNKFREGILWKF